MSRLAKNPIAIPAKTTVSVVGHKVSVKGPLGELSRMFSPAVAIEVKDNAVVVNLVRKGKTDLPIWGTSAAHIKNMLAGVNTAYSKKMLIEGVGYKADVKGKTVVMALGYSHPIELAIPAGVDVKTEKGAITVTSIDKDALGAFAAKIRSYREPEPYKGKGIRYEGEVIKRKQGKKAA